jgi:hypothetical protein
MSDEEKEKCIYLLWKLLDDIDTEGDICKDTHEAYRERVANLVNGRFKILDLKEVDRLYDKYYNKVEDI